MGTAGPTSTGGAPLSSVSELGFSSSNAAAGAASGSAALGAISAITSGSGTQASDDQQASRLEQAAAFGETQATLTDATMRENLNTTLGNIETIRAASGTDPNSPTGAALMDRSTELSDRQRLAAVGTIKQQDAEDMASASYLKQAGDFAVKQSYLNAGIGVATSVAKAFTMGA